MPVQCTSRPAAKALGDHLPDIIGRHQRRSWSARQTLTKLLFRKIYLPCFLNRNRTSYFRLNSIFTPQIILSASTRAQNFRTSNVTIRPSESRSTLNLNANVSRCLYRYALSTPHVQYRTKNHIHWTIQLFVNFTWLGSKENFRKSILGTL